MPHNHRNPVVLIGGVLLALIAGFINAAALRTSDIAVTHVTGSVSRLSADLGAGDATDLLLVLPLVASFIAGAILAGLIVGRDTLRLGRHYGVAMLTEGALLTASAFTLHAGHPGGIFMAAGAAGLQNGMASTYGGLIIRTTHVTGISTDIGFLIGRWITHRDVEPWKFGLLFALFGAFFAGGLVGWAASGQMEALSLLAPAGTLLLMGCIYLVWRSAHFSEGGDPATG
ncbi:MAG: YoaK family protein [Phycisphaerales bacterium JB050]